jgi:hypothetical protein
MRPAPPALSPEADLVSSSPPTEPHKRAWLVAAIVGGIVVIVGVVIFVMTSGGGSSHTVAPSPVTGLPSVSASPTPPPPPRTPFAFAAWSVDPVKTETSNRPAAEAAASDMAERLSSFYDTTFMDPATWNDGLPDSVWGLFDATTAKQAKKDQDSLTLGDDASQIATLTAGNSSLTFTVLLNPAGKAESAVATVSFSATGTLVDGTAVEVSNSATYLFDQQGGTWVVIGYPTAKTTIEPVTSSPSASPSATATATAPTTGSPSPGSSP